MKKQEAVNTFSEGLILDLNPLSMPNNALTNCLNGTLLTYNGNENMLQNDMGNCRVETAMLPTGYIPLGSTSFGGIIYIVSYNPSEDKYLIGSFPSPERNLTKDELGDNSIVEIDLSSFCQEGQEWEGFDSENNIITNYYLKINLLKTLIYPGDKYKVFSEKLINFTEFLSAYGDVRQAHNNSPKYLKIDIVVTLENGKTVILTDNSIWSASDDTLEPFYIYLGNIDAPDGKISLPEYRNLVGSNYDTYISKVSGLLGIVAKLEVPTSFSVGYDILSSEQSDGKHYKFYFYLNWTNDNEGDHKNRINPSKVRYTVGDHEVDEVDEAFNIKLAMDPEKLNYLSTIIPTIDDIGYYQDDFPIEEYLKGPNNLFSTKEYRKNDGTDFQYVIEGPEIIKKNTGYYVDDTEININEDVLNITVTPCMPFGRLDFLKLTISLDMTKLLTGNIYLHNYQYYVDNDEINMEFFIEAYPELGKNIVGGAVEFYPLSEHINSSKWSEQNTYSEEAIVDDLLKEMLATVSIPLLGNVTGLQHITIRKEDYNLISNKIYIAKITLKYGRGLDTVNKVFYRLFFNSNIFNNAYGADQDFKDLYLYESEKNYGLRPTLKFDASTNSTYDDSLVYKFDEYQEEKAIQETSREYRVFHNIESTFKIETGLDNELSLNAEVSLANNKVEVVPSANNKLELLRYSNPSFSLVNDSISLSNEFSVKIPYTIYYSSPTSLKTYALSRLNDGAILHKVILQHVSREENNGKFLLFVNTGEEMNSEDTLKKEYECYDLTSNISFTSYSVESILGSIMNDFNYDYLTVLFGIAKMWDNNCGYGFIEYDKKATEYFYKMALKPYTLFAKITCIRRNGSPILAHRSNLYLKRLSGVSEDQDNDKCYAYRKYSEIIEKNPTDGSIIPSSSTYISQYQKYKKTGDINKVLYYINDVDYVLNPSIDLNYLISLKLDLPKLYICGIQISNLEGLAHNLLIKGLDNFNTAVLINTSINNLDFVNNHLLLTYNNMGWDEINNKVLSPKQLQQVYGESSDNVVDGLIINDNGLVELSEDFSNRCYSTEWYFGWEDTGGKNTLTQISKDEFKKSKLWYSFEGTYVVPGTEASFEGNEIITLYSLTCDTKNLIKGQTYDIRVERVSSSENFLGAILLILCDNGIILESSINDPGIDSFQTDIHVTPTDSPCSIKLILNGELVGQITFSTILEPDTEIDS